MGIRIEKSYYFFGSPIVIYPCPNCRHELKSPVADIGNEDSCSECDQLFEVPGDVEYQIYVDARKPKVIQKPKKPRKSRIQLHLEHLELQTNDIARLEKLKAKALKEGRICDYMRIQYLIRRIVTGRLLKNTEVTKNLNCGARLLTPTTSNRLRNASSTNTC